MKKLYAAYFAVCVCITSASAQPGSLDSSFGKDGKVMTDFNSDESISSSFLQPDGKIVVGGRYDIIPSDDARLEVCAVARYKTNGALDLSFGTNGISLNRVGKSFSGVNSIALQADGSIIAVGYANLHGYFNQLIVLRYKKNGMVDSSFGANGMASVSFARMSVYAKGVCVQPDNKIVVCGTIESFQDKYIVVIRFKQNGQIDSSFGWNGRRITQIGGSSGAQSIALQEDGKIIVAGFSIPLNSLIPQFAVVCYTAAGNPDKHFGTDGCVSTGFDGMSQANSIAAVPGGKIVVAGYAQHGTYFDFAVLRYHSNGIIDSSFGVNGRSITDFGFSDEANSVAMQPDGKIVVAGSSYDAQNTLKTYFALARYKTNGKPDLSFGNDGQLLTGFSGKQSVANTVLIQPDEKILAAGFATQEGFGNQDFALARYLSDFDPLLEKNEPVFSTIMNFDETSAQTKTGK